ncbi:hypothetical protein BHE74_00029766 [Ensete ventricosum]|nr:hypothetical protein GW17_00025523 [Ensete ventricosum]RWW63074.1 hypothetical protein BHE74_00029766 [Ensete ventricosum]
MNAIGGAVRSLILCRASIPHSDSITVRRLRLPMATRISNPHASSRQHNLHRPTPFPKADGPPPLDRTSPRRAPPNPIATVPHPFTILPLGYTEPDAVFPRLGADATSSPPSFGFYGERGDAFGLGPHVP